MEAQSWLMLRILINRYNPKAGNVLLKFLPEEEMQKVASQDIRSDDIMPLLYQPQRLLEQLHYSWIQPLIEEFPQELYPALLGALTPIQASNLKRALNTKSASVSTPVKNFLLNRLYEKLPPEHPLPIEYLPDSDLMGLVHLNKKELVNLIDFLGLHDLAAEVRHIVSRKHLENLYSCLTTKQNYYLKVCLYQKDKLVPPRLGINPATKDCAKLKGILHQRGIVRLGKALCGQHKDFIWYITHILDIGRGKLLLKYYQEYPIPNVTNLLKSQVLNVMNFLKKE